MDQPVIISVGTLCFDVIGTVDGAIPKDSITARLEHLRFEDGGRGANFAMYAAQSGARASIIARVGREFRGGTYWNRLRSAGVGTDLLYHQLDTLTPRTLIFSNPQDMTLYFYPACENQEHEEGYIRHTEHSVKLIPHDAVYCSSEIPTANLVTLAASTATLKIFAPAHDIGRHSVQQLTEALGASDWLIANKVELRLIASSLAKTPTEIVRAFGLRLLVATRGPDGVDLILPGRTLHLDACRPRAVVDPTGAGDAFAGALVTQYLMSGDLLCSAKLATSLASLVVEHIGCLIDPPPVAELASRMALLGEVTGTG